MWQCTACGHPIVNAQVGIVAGDMLGPEKAWAVLHKNRWCDQDLYPEWEDLGRFAGKGGEEWFTHSYTRRDGWLSLLTPLQRAELYAAIVRPGYDQRRVAGPAFAQWLGRVDLRATRWVAPDLLFHRVRDVALEAISQGAWAHPDGLHERVSEVTGIPRVYNLLLGLYAEWQAYGFVYADAPQVSRVGASPRRARKPSYEVERKSFLSWLLTQQFRDDPVGDLARDAAVDDAFPAGNPSLRDIYQHVHSWSMSGPARAAIEAFREWQGLGKTYRATLPQNRPGWLSLRFQILKRDSYRCQLCGRSAQDGARLEVDHKHARSRGGTNDPTNLWTLCFECNRGKRAEEL